MTNNYGPSRTAHKIYDIMAKLSAEGYCDATQDELANTAKISESTLRRAIRQLERHGWIATIRRYYRPYRKTRNSYRLKRGLPVELSTVTSQKMTGWSYDDSGTAGQKMTGWSYDDSVTAGHTAGQKMTAMHDDDDDEKIKKLCITLNFLHESERLKRVREPWCTLDFANAWYDWWIRRDFGGLENPAGWANLEMSRGHWPPMQMHLPETSVEPRPTKKQAKKPWYAGHEDKINF